MQCGGNVGLTLEQSTLLLWQTLAWLPNHTHNSMFSAAGSGACDWPMYVVVAMATSLIDALHTTAFWNM